MHTHTNTQTDTRIYKHTDRHMHIQTLLNTIAALSVWPAPLYLRTLWRYTNSVIIIIIIIN